MTVHTLSSPSGDDNRFFSSCSGVGSASPQISFPKTYMKKKTGILTFPKDCGYCPRNAILATLTGGTQVSAVRNREITVTP